jgi:hypothetical protein
MSAGQTLPPLPSIKLGVYQHYKGQHYQVLGVARHSETLEPLVLYRPMYGEGAMWVRPFHMFEETVTVDGKTQARFTLIQASEINAPT